MKIVILGSTGLIGRMIYTYFNLFTNFELFGLSKTRFFTNTEIINITPFDFFDNKSQIKNILKSIKPNVVINCVGITKHNKQYIDIERVIFLNSLFPKLIADYCEEINSRFIHISTDCVFSGKKGNYIEYDYPDGNDLYSISKYKGELGYNHLVLRISVIGPELITNNGLFSWFISSNNKCKGFSNAFFSGITTLELAKILEEYIIPNNYKGLYHISSYRISKFNLLKLISRIFKKNISIEKDNSLHIDRSLLCNKFLSDSRYRQKKYTMQLKELYEFINQYDLIN